MVARSCWVPRLRTAQYTVNVNNGLEFAASVGTVGLASLAGSGNITLSDQAGSPAAVNLTVGANNSSTTYSGTLSGLGGLTKSGTGTFILSGTNTYGGGTTVGGGTLQMGSTTALGTGGLTITAGTLDLHGFSPSIGTLSGTGGSDHQLRRRQQAR